MKKVVTVFGATLSPREVRKAQSLAHRYAKVDIAHESPYTYTAHTAHPAAALLGVQQLSRDTSGEEIRTGDGIILGTIRMGFGHYRMSLALASAAVSMGLTPYWLDFLAFPESPAARIIHELEHLYNLGSRMSQMSELFNKLIWEKVVLEMGRPLWASYRDRLLGKYFAPLCAGLPGSMPFIAVHPWAAHGALEAGRANVINAIPDNYPLGFHLSEGAIHTVQSPSAYLGFRMLQGMTSQDVTLPREAIRYTGHYVDHELVSNVEHDCALRFKRLRDKKPRRVLLTIGGAGAQAALFIQVIRSLGDLLRSGEIAVLVNLGDHRVRYGELALVAKALGIPSVLHERWEETHGFALAALEKDCRGLHFFLFDEPFPAVYTTNILMRAADFLVTKPSELAFYPVPKLFIKRVGGHEALGATRGAEAGDSTLEIRTSKDVDKVLRMLIQGSDLLHLYNSNIIKNKETGLYDGAYNVIKLALAGRPQV